MRSIRIGIPSRIPKMVMWEYTEDEQAFRIYGISSGKPYIRVHGVRYPLTEEEIEALSKIRRLAK